MELNGAVAVVTGAARGLGKVIAAAFAERGARVALVDVLEDELRKTAAEMREAGRMVLPLVTDVTEALQVEAMTARVEDELGPIDVLVNNAGTFSVIAPVWEADPEKWFRDTRVNLYGSFLCCRAVVKRMIERPSCGERRGLPASGANRGEQKEMADVAASSGQRRRPDQARHRGYVINIVSSGGVGDPHPYSTSYACSKTALMRLTEGLAAEAREHGVKVFALAPQASLTEMTRFIMDDPGGRKWRPGFRKIFEEGRDARPDIVAKTAVDLVSGKADRLTGRYFLAEGDLDETVARTDEILEEDLLTLRIRS